MVKERYLTPYIVNDLQGKDGLCRRSQANRVKQPFAVNLLRLILKNIHISTGIIERPEGHSKRKLAGRQQIADFRRIAQIQKWKGFIKGEYDKLKDAFRFIVTGSTRLDLYRRGGDSLQGRYHYYRLHPFTAAEIAKTFQPAVPFNKLIIPDKTSEDVVESLYAFGGFPRTLSKTDGKASEKMAQ